MSNHFIRALALNELPQEGCRAVTLDAHTIVLFHHQDQVYAVDNRCPHMGFPLDRGTVRDGILTCHWHHARFDLATGGTFDLFADDVPSFPVEIRDGAVWVDLTPPRDPQAYYVHRLNDGLEHELPLVVAKTVIALEALHPEDDKGLAQTFEVGLEFGTRYRRNGWGQGLTMLTCFANLLPYLDAADRPQAMYQGLSAVARDTLDMPPRFMIEALPGAAPDMPILKRWFRRFVEVRDGEGAERCIVTAVRAGASDKQLAEMLFAAATDHRYIQIGHVADFTNKALEALDLTSWEPARAEFVLSSLANGYVDATRQEESNAWRNPIDLVEILEHAFDALADSIEQQKSRDASGHASDIDHELVTILLGDDPQAIADALLDALRAGASEEKLARTVAYIAALRIARFHTSNEFGDWDTALHTFTFANAIHQGIRRVINENTPISTRVELLRGVFDAAMSVYLDRFLNIPPAKLPESEGVANPLQVDEILSELPTLLDHQQQVNQAAALIARYWAGQGDPARLLALMGRLLLREDRDFHTIQTVEAAFRQYDILKGMPEARNLLIAAARYLAAHSPTVRAEGQTYHIARRLHRGEKLFEES
jgi:nitrite reductase/ring-hydroxylating ferredoxin subunit